MQIPCDINFSESTSLNAGDLKCLYENGNLVQIRFGNTELIRKIYGAVRLHNWDTVPVHMESPKILVEAASFNISYTAVYGKTIPLFRAKIEIRGNSDNSISMRMDGEVLEDLSRNRVGLCILHPVPESQGAQAMVTRTDGTTYSGYFPVDIDPYQPFSDINEMAWQDNSGNKLSLIFEGDVFEMEDQRNWSDHSFKTYSTPVSLERPVALKKGDRIQQSVYFSAELSSAIPTNIELTTKKYKLPRIGYSLPLDHSSDTLLLENMPNIPFHHLRVSVDLSGSEWKSTFERAIMLAIKLSAKLEIVLIWNNIDSIKAFIKEYASDGYNFYSILPVISFNDFAEAYDLLKSAFPETLIGYGTDDSFAGLNRNRPSGFSFDFLSFPVTPQAHAFDNRTIVENLFSHCSMLKTAASFANGKPVHISPVTLIDRGLAESADERQYSSFLAAWAMHFFQTFAGTASITFFDISGENGILKKENDRVIFSPLYKILQALQAFEAVTVFSTDNFPEPEIIFENAKGEQLIYETDILSSIAIENA